MIQATQQIDEITRSNILNLFPEYSLFFEYSTEPIESATLKSTARIGNYLYHSTVEGNIGNDPLDTLGKYWVQGDVSNIYAMLDFENVTKTQWEQDGVVEFEKGSSTILALGAIEAGCVSVDMLEPKNGVLGSGLALSNDGVNYTLTIGEWYTLNKYGSDEDGWNFINSDMVYNRDNYIYPEKARRADNLANKLAGTQGIAISGTVAYVVSQNGDSITSVDISNPNLMVELGSYTSASLDGANGIAISGTVAYVVSANADSITSIDISDPSAMTELDSYTSANLNGARAIAIDGTVAYVVSQTASSITSIDITNPSIMAQLDSHSSVNMNIANGIAISGTTAYVVATFADSITSINITTPTAMLELDSYTSASLDGAAGIAISGTVAYVASTVADSITSIDITTPTALAELDSYTSVNLDFAQGIAISGTVAYVVSANADSITSIDINYPDAMTELDSYPSKNQNAGYGIAISGAVAYIGSEIASIDISTPSVLTEKDSLPKNAPLIVSVNVGDPQPTTPDGELLIWKITLSAGGVLVSMTDLRDLINDNPIDGLTQIRTFYNEGKGAGYFLLPELGEIVRITFKEANNAGTACGTMIAGKGIDMGKTLTDVSFSQVPVGREYIDEAAITTILDNRDVTLVAHQAKQAIGDDTLLVIDPSIDSVYQQMLILGKIVDVPYSIRAMNKQHLGIKLQGEEMVNEIPLYVYDVAFFIAGVTEILEVYKGCGSMNFTRPFTATYIDEYGNTKTAAIDEPRFQDGMLMSDTGEVCWYDAVESIPTFENGFTFEWEGITDSLSAGNTAKTYIMSNEDVQLYFQGEILYFYINGDSLPYALPILNTRIKVEIRAKANGEVTMVIDDVEVASATMDISNVSSSLTYIGSQNGAANTSGVLLQTASHKWYNTTLDGATTTIPPEVWVNESLVPWVDESANQWTTG